jgi:RND family efflux transporter MFP subunit
MSISNSDRKNLSILAAILAATVAGCDRPIVATTSPGREKQTQPVAKVEVVRPARQTMRRTVEEPGQVEAFETTAIHAKVAGYVRSWSVNIGSRITKGQVMAELDVPEADAEAEEKRAMVEQAQAKRAQAEAAVEVARAETVASDARLVEARAGMKRVEADLTRWQSEFARVEQLFRERAQTGSLLDETRSKVRGAEAMRDEIEAQVRTAQAAVALAKASLDKALADVSAAAAGVSVARSELRGAEALLAYTRIVAPYDGVVTRRNVDTGHLTIPGGNSEPLFVVARSDLVTVAVHVPELFAAAVEPGDRALIRLQSIPGKPFEGKVTRSAYALDPKSRTLRVEIDLANPDGKLHPGLYAYASIIAEEHTDALTIPTSAIGRDIDKPYCVVVRDGHASRRPIELGLSDGASTEVVSGLLGDELVVKAGVASLLDGQPVESTGPATSPSSPTKP